MPVFLILTFIVIPISEIVVLITLGQYFGLAATLGLIFLTALMGTMLLRHQGLQTLAEVQKSLGQGELPVGELLKGLCLLCAGVLLLTPGFLTDSIGFTLFIPAIRSVLVTKLVPFA